MLCFGVILAPPPRRPTFSLRLSLQRPVLRMLFQVPYPVSPLLATLAKTAGVCTNNSQLGTNLSPFATSHLRPPKSLRCHTSEKTPERPPVATDPKTHLS